MVFICLSVLAALILSNGEYILAIMEREGGYFTVFQIFQLENLKLSDISAHETELDQQNYFELGRI